MNAREIEDHMLNRCMAVARNVPTVANDQQEANVFRVAGMVMRSSFPPAAANLMRASDNYFLAHPGDKLHAAEVVRHGWIFSLPRLRDMLTMKLQHR